MRRNISSLRLALTGLLLAGLFFGAAGMNHAADVSAAPPFFDNPTTSVFINEFHYDNIGTDTGEAIEIAGPAGTDLSGWSILLYNGSGGGVYGTTSLTGTIPNQQGGYGTLSFTPSVAIQNGPDGIALVDASSTVIQFLSYEGTFTASDGAANGQTSTDIGISQQGTELVGSSLQLIGTGNTYGNFSWINTATNTFGLPNTGQTFGDSSPTISSTSPINGATNVAVGSNIVITFSEPVDVTGNWFNISCGNSAAHTATVSGGPTIFLLDPDNDFFTDEICVVVVYASQVSDQDGAPNLMAANYSFSFGTVRTPACTPIPTADVRSVIINEIAWMGTSAFEGDEWIELYNPGSTQICLTGWKLEAADGNPSISLSGPIEPGGYLVLERDDDNVISDFNAPDDPVLVYNGGLLEDTGETLCLRSPDRKVIDTANGNSSCVDNGGSWPAGLASPNGSMERMSTGADDDSIWVTNVESSSWLHYDARGTGSANYKIRGTPGGLNWGYGVIHTPTPTATATATATLTPTPSLPKTITITEVGWMGTATTLADDEWIELYNNTNLPIDLTNWRIKASDGTPNILITACKPVNPDCIIPARGYFLLERTDDTTISDIEADMIYTGNDMSNSGEVLSLYDSSYNPINPDASRVDMVNHNGGAWPAGSASTFGSMERGDPLANDSDSAWMTHTGASPRWGKDANGNPIKGTPKHANWAYTVTPTPLPSPTPTRTPTGTPAPFNFKTVVITELGWMGTAAASSDEWIELYNTTNAPIVLDGWRLRSYRYTGSYFVLNLDIALKGTIPPRTSSDPKDTSGYFLLEAVDDNTVSNIEADQIYSGSLYNTGEILLLCSTYNLQVAHNCNINEKNKIVDYVNASLDTNGKVKPWPAGNSSTYGSMERKNLLSDEPTNYLTHTGHNPRWGMDANGNDIKGTPKHPNWAFEVTPTPGPTGTKTRTPTPLPRAVPILVLNEFLPRPGHDWNNDGQVNVYDEFIEVMNAGTVNVNLSGYKLDDYELGADGKVIANAFTLPSMNLKPGEKAVFYAWQTGIQLSDAGDTVRLLKSNNTVADAYTYPPVKSLDVSWCRLTDGYGSWLDRCFPTPGLPNSLVGGTFPPAPDTDRPAAVCLLPDSAPDEFLRAECEEGGLGIWNPAYWDETAGAGGELWIPEERGKGLVLFE